MTFVIAVLRFSGSQMDSINLSLLVGLSVLESAAGSTVPSSQAIGDSLLLSCAKASSSWSCCDWVFCRLLLMSSRAYLPLHLPRLSRGTVRAFVAPLRSCEPRPFLPFRVSVPLKRIGFARLLCPLLTSGMRSPLLAERSVRVVAARQFLPDTRQTSQVKLDNLRRTPAGFTALAFDGWRTSPCSGGSSHQHCLLSDSCTSGHDFAPRCLQTPPHDDALALR